MEAAFVGRQPMGLLGRMAEIVQAVLFAAGYETAFMTGGVAVIDDGMTMWVNFCIV